MAKEQHQSSPAESSDLRNRPAGTEGCDEGAPRERSVIRAELHAIIMAHHPAGPWRDWLLDGLLEGKPQSGPAPGVEVSGCEVRPMEQMELFR